MTETERHQGHRLQRPAADLSAQCDRRQALFADFGYSPQRAQKSRGEGVEAAGDALLARGVNVSVVRLPQVHDTVKQGLVTYSIAVARQKGVSAYIGDGLNRWAAVHVLDAARLYRLALEKGADAKAEPGARCHAVAEEGVFARDIAEVVGRGLNVPIVSMTPEEAAGHFGWLAMFAGLDIVASSAQTQERLGWRPVGPGLIADLEQMRYQP